MDCVTCNCTHLTPAGWTTILREQNVTVAGEHHLMDTRARTSGNETASPAAAPGYSGKVLDTTPPPDHQDYVEARANGLRATRERREKRRRKK